MGKKESNAGLCARVLLCHNEHYTTHYQRAPFRGKTIGKKTQVKKNTCIAPSLLSLPVRPFPTPLFARSTFFVADFAKVCCLVRKVTRKGNK